MPQLNPAPWLMTFVTAWIVLMLFSPMLAHPHITPPSQLYQESTTNPWPWTWH